MLSLNSVWFPRRGGLTFWAGQKVSKDPAKGRLLKAVPLWNPPPKTLVKAVLPGGQLIVAASTTASRWCSGV